ncbi:MAG: DUF434 domain-containing protein [Phycisphaerae bacterium]
MPDKRKHRGAHPDDARLFAEAHQAALRLAVEEYAWLLTRDYADESALKLVGDRHNLTARQRLAVWRSACSDQALHRRAQAETPLSQCVPTRLGIDGYNLLITIESALSGGLVLIGRDGCRRDLASIHGTYRKVSETIPAVELIADHLTQAGATSIDWYLDQPVSNSGRLKVLMAKLLEARSLHWNIELPDNPDRKLADYTGVVASADGWILDHCRSWVNLAADIIETHIPDAWIVDLRTA